ncbi:expressed gene 1 homolog [Octopus vulgaris]|uniref:Expressed gene 1 homolog n=2 Tax=Octopus TaxID=6643 RepID=A0AA36F657_OCTVU|nr:meiosis expressed gene 1 protein homolog [Octopus sinensis]CAI9723728.1 expressed gene 1 homolog [Octopus vulgaris]
MERLEPKPKSISRAQKWTDSVEEAYRFQCAGYRDEMEYKYFQKAKIDRWPHNGYVKKLQRKDGSFFYFNKTRECPEKDISKTKLYVY